MAVRTARSFRPARPRRETLINPRATSSITVRISCWSHSPSSRTISPSARKSTRCATAAARASCVTMTMVCPYSSTDRRSSSRISPLVAESRLPVGSSANSTVGLETSARAIATRCCWPPESSDGRCDRRSPRPTSDTSWSNHASSGFSPAMVSGRRMFSLAVSIGNRLKNWKTKPMCSRRSFVRSLSPSVVISVPADADGARSRLVEPREDVHQRRLARARRAHDGRGLARRDRRP